MQKHLEYHNQLHAKPDAFACDIESEGRICGKHFSNPSSLRIHKLLDHERPDTESSAVRHLRELFASTSNELEQAKSTLQVSQKKANKVSSEARELRKLSRQREMHLNSLRHEHNLLVQQYAAINGKEPGSLVPISSSWGPGADVPAQAPPTEPAEQPGCNVLWASQGAS